MEKAIKDLEEIMKYEEGEGKDNEEGKDKGKGEEAKVARGLTTHLQLLWLNLPNVSLNQGRIATSTQIELTVRA